MCFYEKNSSLKTTSERFSQALLDKLKGKADDEAEIKQGKKKY